MAHEKMSKTLLERYGFKDPDLSLPLHDQIIQWAYDNIENIAIETASRSGVGNYYDKSKTRWSEKGVAEREKEAHDDIIKAAESTEGNIRRCQQWISDSWNVSKTEQDLERLRVELEELKKWSGLGEPPPYSPLSVQDVRWEHPIATENGRSKYIVGYLDLVATVCIPHLSVISRIKEAGFPSSRSYDWQLPQWHLDSTPVAKLCIEAKTEIRTVGELLRQINHYKEYQRGTYIVISPDDRHRQVLETQGVCFIHYPFGKGSASETARQGTLL